MKEGRTAEVLRHAMPNSPESAEDRLIARYFRPLAKHPGALGLVDDAAVITPPPGCDVVLTTDGVIAGVHVLPDDRPENTSPPAMTPSVVSTTSHPGGG